MNRFAAVLVAVTVCGCSGPSSPPDGGATDAGGTDAGTFVHNCTEADFAADVNPQGVDVTLRPDGGLLHRCARIPPGERGFFSWDFALRPLTPDGQPSNPIPSRNTGSATFQVNFPDAGTFGFQVGTQPAAQVGAIDVR